MTTGDAGTSSNARLSAAGMLKRMRKYRLLPETEIERVEREVLPQAQDTADLARRLIRAKLLTKFQCNHILGGKAAKLRLGSYVVQDRIGAGGMGEVYRAWHPRLNRLAAIKILPARLVSDVDAVQRFHREARAAAQLSHPNVVMTFDADESGGVHYLVMEYVEGTDLAAVVRRDGPLSVAQAVSCIAQTARGLEYAHGQGVIHRDIKPHNLLLDSDGTIRILDLGLARVDEDDRQEQLTATGSVMGTVDFMPPEQAEDSRRADERADIYSLGCTLYYLLGGQPMYAGSTAVQKILAHREQPVPPLTAARENVPAVLDAVYRRMVAKVPAERYQSMTEVLSALQETQLLESEPTLPAGAPPTRSPVTEQSGTADTIDHRRPSRTAETVNSSQDLQETVLTGTSVGQRVRHSARKKTLLAALAVIVLLACAGLVLSLKSPTGIPVVLDGDTAIVGANRDDNGGTASGSADVVDLIRFANARDAGPPGKSATEKAPAGRVSRLRETESPPLAVAPFDANQARQHQQAWADYLGLPLEKQLVVGTDDDGRDVALTMVLIPPGEFQMGSAAEDQARFLETVIPTNDIFAINEIRNEVPQHRVRITRPFYLGKYEVTQAQWLSVIGGNNPSAFQDGPTHPVEQVSWDEIQRFVETLNERSAVEHLEFVLPTEARWEYSCRAGTTTPFYCGDSEVLQEYGWFNRNARGRTHPVGGLKANAFGLHDMHGNVWERCSDRAAKDYYARSPVNDPAGPSAGSRRYARGGSWWDHSWRCRSAFRGRNYNHSDSNREAGFRLAADIELPEVDGTPGD